MGATSKWLIATLVEDICDAGYKGADVVIKCNQEGALMAAQNQISRLREGVRTVPRHSPTGESQANGRIEDAIQSTQGASDGS